MVKHNVISLRLAINSGQPLTWLTCYDYSFASALNETDVDMILVGDSGGMVSLGYQDTVPVTMDEMLVLARSVRRGAPNKFIVGDMPKGAYESTNELAVLNAMRFVKESGCDAVKLEGGSVMVPRVKAIVDAGIPVVGHIGLTPQSSAAQGGYRVVGRTADEVGELKSATELLTDAGAFAILLEAIPPEVARRLTQETRTIIFGIGAGKFTHGQLLILHDLLGLYPDFRPRFAKCYIPNVIGQFASELEGQPDLINYGRQSRNDGLYGITKLAVQKFIQEVKEGLFPNETYSYKD